MNWLPGPETRAAVLKHPFVLAGFAVVVLLGLTAAVLVVVDSARNSSGAGVPTVVVESAGTAAPGPASQTASATGVTGTTNAVATVRSAPGARTPVLGTLGKGEDVVIDGRTTDTKWYRVMFPPNSELHGWISAEFLDVTGDPESLVVATAEPPVVVDLPTVPPESLTAAAQQRTPTEEATPSVTETPASGKLPDLVMGTTPTLVEGKLFVTVVNQGQGDATGDLVVAVFNADGTKLLAGATLPNFTLQAGRSIDVGTGYDVTESQTLLLIVDPNGDIPETDDTNNRATIAVAVGNPEPTRSAVPFETPIAPNAAATKTPHP